MSETVPKRLRPSHGGGSSTVGIHRGHHKQGHGHTEAGRKLKAASERGDSAIVGHSRRKRQNLLEGLEGRQFNKFQSEDNLHGRPVEAGAAGVVGGNGTPTPSEKVHDGTETYSWCPLVPLRSPIPGIAYVTSACPSTAPTSFTTRS